MEAARVAQGRSGGDDVKKRLMIVSDVHITRLVTAQRNGSTVVTDVLLKQFGAEQSVPVPEDGVVILALGTIENARLALTSFPNLPNTNLIGENLMAHLRSNLTIRKGHTFGRVGRTQLAARLRRYYPLEPGPGSLERHGRSC
jgi:hypothetical protein